MHTVDIGFGIAGSLISAYQGMRGFMLQFIGCNKMFEKHKIWLLCISDALLYVSCSAAGFFRYFSHTNSLSDCQTPPTSPWGQQRS